MWRNRKRGKHRIQVYMGFISTVSYSVSLFFWPSLILRCLQLLEVETVGYKLMVERNAKCIGVYNLQC